MRNLTHKWIRSILFPKKFGQFFPILKNGQGSPTTPPPPPNSCVRGLVLKKVQDDSEPVPQTAYKWFVARRKRATGGKTVKPII